MPLWEQSTPVQEKPQRWQSSAVDPTNFEFDEKTSGQVYDASVDAQIPTDEAENLFAMTGQPTTPISDGIVKRFGKQFYNATVANVVTTVGAKSELGKIRTDLNSLAILEGDFKKRLESGLPVTEQEIEFYAKPYDRWTIGSIFGAKQPDWKVKAWSDYQAGKLNIGKTPNPQEALRQFIEVQKEAEQKTFQQTNIAFPVSEPTGAVEKFADAFAGTAGFIAQVAVFKRAAPSMPEWLVWENVNLANGGTPGGGAAMQLSMGGLNRVIPGTGFVPAVERGTAAGTLFGTTTYLGGGDTVDVLIGAGIPFAFEGIGLTRQTWANYKNKKTMIQTIKDKAPALKDKPDIEIDKAITFLLTNVEPAKPGTDLLTKGEMEKQFAPEIPTKPLQDLSAEVKDYMQRQRYDELLEKANSGDKKAIKDLNNYIQSVPTYDEILERGFAGDATAFDMLNSGQYRGGVNPPAPTDLKIPGTPQAGVEHKEAKPLRKSQATEKADLNKKVYMKGFAARLTSIRNNADNLVAGAGKKEDQIKVIQEELAKIEEHYKTIGGDVEKNKHLLPELSQIKDLLPDYSKAVNDFTVTPSKDNFERIKIIGDKIGELSTAYGQQVQPEPARPTEPKTPIQQIREHVTFAANADTKPAPIDPKDMKRARERGFITSAKEILPLLRIEGQYIPRPTDPLAIKARNLVLDDIAMAEKLARSGSTDKAVATASELIKYYGDKAQQAKSVAEADALYEKAAAVASDVAVTLTEAGRTVQAASILGRMTPEGQLRFAAREIQKHNERVSKQRGGIGGLQKRIPDLTPAQTKHILGEMAEIEKMPESKEKYIRFQKLQDQISELIPTPLYKKIITVWKAGLLTGIKTSGLNILSNIGHLGTETVKDIPASMVDKIVGLFTGQRTVTPTIKGLGGGALEGVGKGLEYLKSGYSEREIGTKFDYRKVNFGRGNLARALQAYTETIFRFLGSQDQPFYYAAKLRSMYEQAKVSAMNLGLKGKPAQDHIDTLMRNPTEKMVQYATKDAETAVYLNNTKLGDIARGIQRLPGGEIVVPFGRTPSSVAMQIVNYSPVGIAKTIIENIGKGRFDQRNFSQGLGRGLTGTAVLVIGAKLYDQGLIALDRPSTERERKLWELEGRQPNSVKMGDQWRTIQAFGPAGNLLIVGGHFRRAFGEAGSPTEAMSEALAGSANSFTEQTFLRGVNQFVDALSDPQRSATYVAGTTISSIIPTLIADVARATDTGERRAETLPQKMMMRVPGARQTLEPQVTVLGEERQPTANPIELMVDPTRPSKEISTPVVKELRRLWDEGWEVSPNLLGTKKGYDVLTPAENTELWKRVGSITKEALTKLIENPLYADLPDEKKADFISKIVTESQDAAKIEAVAKKLTGVEDKELTKMVFELRKSGLADEDIIPMALSKRNPRAARKD